MGSDPVWAVLRNACRSQLTRTAFLRTDLGKSRPTSHLPATKNDVEHALYPTLAFRRKKSKVPGSSGPRGFVVRESIITVCRAKTGLDLRLMSRVAVTTEFLTVKDQERSTQFLVRLGLLHPIAMTHRLIYPADQGWATACGTPHDVQR